jgi:exopolyphosphatase / guanosine-5'-triphosphate,3'-diphosphate pyrophosphatase
MRPIAAIDIGSNTVHLLVGVGKRGKAVEHLISESELLELGREVERHERIRAKKVRQLESILRGQLKVGRKAGAKEVLIAATRALRAAGNGARVVEQLEKALGVPVRLLSEKAEARLAFVGAAPDLDADDAQVLIDSGGASTEVTLTSGRRRRAATSMPIGSSLLCTQLQRDPPGPLEWAQLSLRLADALKTLPAVPRPVGALAVGGSAHRIEELHDGGHGAPVALSDLERIARRLLRHRARHIARATGIEKGKVTLLAAGTLIIHAVLSHYGLDLVRIGHHGLRDGMITGFQRAGGNWWRHEHASAARRS